MDIYKHFNELYFHTASSSIDECVFGVAMPMNHMKAIPECDSMLAAYPCLTHLKADIMNDVLSYSTSWGGKTEKGILLHWGTVETHKPLYMFNVECLTYRINQPCKSTITNKLKYEYRLRYYYLCLKNGIINLLTFPFSFARRVINYLKRKLHRK